MRLPNRREFLKRALVTVSAGPLLARAGRVSAEPNTKRPNVILILTDDQGYGDLGCHGNELIKTPNLDKLHDEGVRFARFYVCPVCSPTRSSLMTGRYNYRTRVVDTYAGRSMMDPDEVTIAEVLSKNGYRTGIFGKWHLGDNYPMRATDQGFEESLVHHGGGLAQPSGPPGNSYFDPVLKHNGVDGPYKGYCTDIFTDAAIAFIEKNREKPFFVYLATNAPHSPLIVDEKYSAPYLAKGLDADTAKTYGMIVNIDENVGRLMAKLQELGLDEDTVVIFMTDNGAALGRDSKRYNAGMRAGKGSVYEGGIRVPCFVRWPARLEAGKEVDRIAAHIDIFPTLLDACGVPQPENVRLDGKSLLPLLTQDEVEWADRTLFFQWHRGDEPEPFRDCAVRTQQYKLVNGKELYDIEADPGEEHDIAADHPELVADMRARYEAWFKDVSATRGYAPPRIYLGTLHENPVVLTRQDWRGANGWVDKDIGYWEVKVTRPGRYAVRLDFPAFSEVGTAYFLCQDIVLEQTLEPGAASCTFNGVRLKPGDAQIEVWIAKGDVSVGVHYVTVKRLGRGQNNCNCKPYDVR